MLARFAVFTRLTALLWSVAAFVLGFLARGVQIEHFALVYPHLDADDAVGRLGLGETVIDVGAQRVQRHAAFAVPLRTCDLGAIQATADVDLDAERSQTHRIADGALHRAAEHDAALKLLRDRFSHQLCVDFGLAHFAHVDVRGNAHHRADFLAQLLDVLALLANHHTRTCRMDGDACALGRTLDLD